MNDDRRALLWDFVYGLLNDADAQALRQQITSDRDLARDYARVKLQSELVASAARATAEAGCWPEWKTETSGVTLAAKHSRSNAARLASNVVTLVASSLAAVLLLYVGYAYLRSDSPLLTSEATMVAQAANAFPRMLVTGPTTLVRSLRRTVASPNSAAPMERSQPLEPTESVTLRGELAFPFAEYEVLFQRLDSQPVAMPVQVTLRDQDNQSLWQKHFTSAADGILRFSLPTPVGDTRGVQLHIAAEPEQASPLPNEFEALALPELTTWLTVVDSEPKRALAYEIFPLASDVALYREVVDQHSYVGRESSDPSNGTDDLPHVRWGVINPQLFAESPQQLAGSLGDGSLPWRFALRETESLAKKGELLHHSAAPLDAVAATEYALAGSDVKHLGESTKGMEEQALSRSNSFSDVSLATTKNPALASDSPRLVVESVVQQQQVISSRFIAVEGSTKPDRQVRAESASHDDSYHLPGDRAQYDFTTAPPELLQRKIPAALENRSLHATTRFNRFEYQAGQEIIASVVVRDETARPQPAILGVWVEQFAPEASEPLDRFADLQMTASNEALDGPSLQETLGTFAASVPLGDVERAEQALRVLPAAEVPLPLVFDNGLAQQERIANFLNTWRAKQFQQRISLRRALLVGSGIGLLFMAAAACGDWLPKRRVWLTISLVLGSCLLLGMTTSTTRPESDQGALALAQPPLANFGLCDQPPPATHSLALDINSFYAYDSPALNGNFFNGPGGGTAFFSLPQQENHGERFFKATTTIRQSSALHDVPRVWQWAELATLNDQEAKEVAVLAKLESDALDLSYSTQLPEQVRLFGALPRSLGEEALAERAKQPSPAVRTIVCWHPGIATDKEGRAELRFTLPNSVHGFLLVVEAHSSQRHGTAATTIPTTYTLNR